jgi:hypothetical protein
MIDHDTFSIFPLTWAIACNVVQHAYKQKFSEIFLCAYFIQ